MDETSSLVPPGPMSVKSAWIFVVNVDTQYHAKQLGDGMARTSSSMVMPKNPGGSEEAEEGKEKVEFHFVLRS